MASPTTIPKLDGTLGAFELGVLFSSILMGAVTVQTYYYFSKFPNDTRILKGLIVIIWMCELGQTICIFHTLYLTTVTFWGNPWILLNNPKSISVAALFPAVSTSLVQSILAWRIHILSHKWIISLICWTLAFYWFAAHIASVAGFVKEAGYSQYERKWSWVTLSTLPVAAANDLLITASLTFWLLKQRSGIRAKSTMAIIDKLILWIFQTGLLTSMLALAILIMFLTLKNESVKLVWYSVAAFQAKIYSNSLMAVLNGRATIREMDKSTIEFGAGVLSDRSRVRSRRSGPDLEENTEADNMTNA